MSRQCVVLRVVLAFGLAFAGACGDGAAAPTSGRHVAPHAVPSASAAPPRAAVPRAATSTAPDTRSSVAASYELGQVFRFGAGSGSEPELIGRNSSGVPENLAFVDPCAAGNEVADPDAALGALRPDWAAGDLMEHVDLGDGSSLWIFGDSYLGDTDRHGALEPGWRFVNSSALRQRGACFELVERSDGGAWIPATDADAIVWPQEALVVGDQLYVFAVRIERDPTMPPGLAFQPVGGQVTVYGVDDLSVPRTTITDVPHVRGNPFGWGALIHEGWVYLNAHEEATGAYLARLRPGEILDPGKWVFWDGTGWDADATAAVPVVGERARMVSEEDGTFSALAVPFLEQKLRMYRADRPEGPWRDLGAVDLDALQVAPDPAVTSWYYEPIFIDPALATTRTVAVNVLPVDPSLIPGDVDLYGPQFVEVQLPD